MSDIAEPLSDAELKRLLADTDPFDKGLEARLIRSLAAARAIVATLTASTLDRARDLGGAEGLREAALRYLDAEVNLDAWDMTHGYVINSERDALAAQVAAAGADLRALAATPPEPAGLDVERLRRTMPEWFGQVPDWALQEWVVALRADGAER